MPLDGKTKKIKKRQLSMPEISTQAYVSEDEEEGEEEGETDEDYDHNEEDNREGSSGSDSDPPRSEDLEDAEDTTPSAALRLMPDKKQVKRNATKTSTKRKIRSVVSSVDKKKRPRIERNEERSEKHHERNEERKEKHHAPTTPMEQEQSSSTMVTPETEGEKKTTKKEAQLFNDKNCDFDLFKQAPNNVHPRKIKISNNVIVTCRMIEQTEGKTLTYDYAGLTFQRKTQNDRMFEFVLPLTTAPRIIEALQLIMSSNHKFFSNEKATPMDKSN